MNDRSSGSDSLASFAVHLPVVVGTSEQRGKATARDAVVWEVAREWEVVLTEIGFPHCARGVQESVVLT